MRLKKLSKSRIGICCCISVQNFAMPSDERKQNQNDPRPSVPFGRAIARSAHGRRFAGKVLLGRPAHKKFIHSGLPAAVQSLESKKGKLLPNRPTPKKNIHLKSTAVAQDFSGKRGDSLSEPVVAKDSVPEASPISSEAIPSENDLAVGFDGTPSERVTIPTGYKLHNVPGDGLCGYWATLAARKALEADDGTSVQVEKKEVFELLRQLSDCIAYTVEKGDKTDQEVEMVDEIDQMFRGGYAKDYGDLYRRIEGGQMQLDSPLAVFLAQAIGYHIILEWKGIKSGKSIHVRERYRADDARGTIIIYYSGNGSGGHYRAIIPCKINVVFDQRS
jgi:hypothetical protein